LSSFFAYFFLFFLSFILFFFLFSSKWEYFLGMKKDESRFPNEINLFEMSAWISILKFEIKTIPFFNF
jgi:hypothetical protein